MARQGEWRAWGCSPRGWGAGRGRPGREGWAGLGRRVRAAASLGTSLLPVSRDRPGGPHAPGGSGRIHEPLRGPDPVADPVHVVGHAGVDARLVELPAAVTPADGAVQVGHAVLLAGQGSARVSLRQRHRSELGVGLERPKAQPLGTQKLPHHPAPGPPYPYRESPGRHLRPTPLTQGSPGPHGRLPDSLGPMAKVLTSKRGRCRMLPDLTDRKPAPAATVPGLAHGPTFWHTLCPQPHPA